MNKKLTQLIIASTRAHPQLPGPPALQTHATPAGIFPGSTAYLRPPSTSREHIFHFRRAHLALLETAPARTQHFQRVHPALPESAPGLSMTCAWYF